jgi:hypothetical protein
MNAERLLVTTDAQGWLTGLPQFEPNQEVECVLLFLKPKPVAKKNVYRKPPAELTQKIKILADILAPVVDENDWNALQ